MKKILIISYYWPPSGGAGVQRWLKFAKYLPEFGFKPIILTVDENYASYPQKDESLLAEASSIETHKTKTFELYSLYSSLKKDKQIPYGGFSNEAEPNLVQKIARAARGNLFIPDPRKGWNKYAFAKAEKLIKEHNIEVVITTSPPHSTQLIGLELKKKFNSLFWIADLRDPWTDIYFYDKFYPSNIARKIDSNYEKDVITKSDKVITVSNSIKQILAKRYNAENKIEVLANGYDETDFSTELFQNILKSKEIVYTGTLTNDYPLDEVIKIAKNNKELVFRFIGSSPSEFIDRVNKENLSERFVFEKTIPHNEITKRMIEAGILLLLIPKVPQNEGILTGKLFEYIGSRTPILAIGPNNSDAKKIIEKTNSGLFFTYQESAKIDNSTITKLYSKQSNNEYNNYSRRNLTKQLVKMIKD
ncbi:MAG: hypothetical protein DRI86_12125 [Bacteroidetes bacterium]|nr:MAG: hypothetical protein DRI86_12125 [Bacteroidota bacterium]